VRVIYFERIEQKQRLVDELVRREEVERQLEWLDVRRQRLVG
jgi:hypothetical protein